MKTLLNTAAISAFAASGAFAQTATTETDIQGGQVVVEQEDATVNVSVPDPDIDVTQGQPSSPLSSRSRKSPLSCPSPR
ncbi:hypothetical protein AL037_07480 [Salipiger aestuarii]|nr:hypothetical protein AL037_07480 [Salipiger aestuarii]